MSETNWEKLHIAKDQEPFGIGAEKKVYRDIVNTERVIGVRHVSESLPSEAKGRYFLGKILHLLLPKNIPDIHLSSTKPSITVRKKVELGLAHHVIREQWLKEEMIDRANEHHINRAMSDIANDPKVRELKDKLHDIGVDVDNFPGNFGIDDDGNAQYIEDFDAFAASGEPFFDLEKLTAAIDDLPEKERKEVSRYLGKLKSLAEVVKNERKLPKTYYETN